MRNKGIFILLAVFPLIAWSCSKAGIVPEVIESPATHADPWTIYPAKAVFVGSGNMSVSADNGEETKSQIELDSETHASVKWTANDSFQMLDSENHYTEYSTTGSGPKVEFTGGATLPSSGPFHSFYPSSAFVGVGTYLAKTVYRVTIPKDQAATIGSVAEEANISYAQSTTQTEDLHFQNVVSLIKFHLEGSKVSSIKKITFGGTSVLSGTVVISPTTEGRPEILGISFSVDSDYSFVTLNGSFEAGKDYYIAVAPGIQDSFYMTFANEGGTQKITRRSSKVLTLNRSRITDLGTITLDSFDDDSMAPVAWNIHDPSHSDFATIAVIPDGYIKDDMDQYETDASVGLDALFKTEPYKSYKEYFNVWILKVASNESGARISDGTLEQQNRDCFFQSSWKAEKYDDMRANDNRVFQFVQDNCPDIINGTHEIKDVPILMIINDARFGGIAWNFSDGSTYCMVPKTYGGNPIEWAYPTEEAKGKTNTRSDGLHTVDPTELTALGGSNVGTWKNTLVHEFGGHSIAKLGDEYWYPNENDKEAVEAIAQHTWPVPMYLNVSAKPAQENTPWAGLFNSTIQSKMQTRCTALSIPNYYSQRIDVFQGADVSTFNRWRSEKVSCMIDNRFYFSTWQRYLIVNRIRTLAGLSEFTISDFLDNDDPRDPKRDGVSSPVMRPVGVSDIVPPRPVPMLPPPRYVDKPAL